MFHGYILAVGALALPDIDGYFLHDRINYYLIN